MIMNKDRFCVGDVVVAKADDPKGYRGIVRKIDIQKSMLVEFPGWGKGHTGSGTSKAEDCWWMSGDELDFITRPSSLTEVETAHISTAEAEDNTTDIMDAENPKRRLMAAYEKFEAAIRQQDEACEEIAQIVREMRNK